MSGSATVDLMDGITWITGKRHSIISTGFVVVDHIRISKSLGIQSHFMPPPPPPPNGMSGSATEDLMDDITWITGKRHSIISTGFVVVHLMDAITWITGKRHSIISTGFVGEVYGVILVDPQHPLVHEPRGVSHQQIAIIVGYLK